MTTFVIRNAQLVFPGEAIRGGDLLVRDGRIVSAGVVDDAAAQGAATFDAGGRRV
ncbi:MAG: hypothetical protein JSR79_04565, partial [Proteobacteria bacterium]|nr:hypothetical protein [Pseudomonadota bacterium]